MTDLTKIKKPLAEDILFGDLVNGGDVYVSVTAGDIALEVQPPESKAAPKQDTRADADA